MLSLPLPLYENVSGGINLYAGEPHAFDEPSREFARRCGSYAAVVAGNMLVYESALDRARRSAEDDGGASACSASRSAGRAIGRS